MAEAPKNYTEEMVEKLHAMYAELGNDGIPQIAKELERSPNSVRMKLVNDGLYVKPEAKPKATKDSGPSKKELIAALGKVAPPKIVAELDGFMPAQKAALAELLDYFEHLAVEAEVEEQWYQEQEDNPDEDEPDEDSVAA